MALRKEAREYLFVKINELFKKQIESILNEVIKNRKNKSILREEVKIKSLNDKRMKLELTYRESLRKIKTEIDKINEIIIERGGHQGFVQDNATIDRNGVHPRRYNVEELSWHIKNDNHLIDNFSKCIPIADYKKIKDICNKKEKLTERIILCGATDAEELLDEIRKEFE